MTTAQPPRNVPPETCAHEADANPKLLGTEEMLAAYEGVLAVFEALLACEEVAPGWIDSSSQLRTIEPQVWASILRGAIAMAKGEGTRS